MNEEAIKDGYNYFVSTGYNGSYEDYVTLINTNENALNDTYSHFKSTGYNKGLNDFKSLMGVGGKETEVAVKKKDQPQQDTESVSADGSSDSQESDPRDVFVGGEILFDTSPTKEEDAKYQEYFKAKEAEFYFQSPADGESESNKKLQEFYAEDKPQDGGGKLDASIQEKYKKAKKLREEGKKEEAKKIEKEINRVGKEELTELEKKYIEEADKLRQKGENDKADYIEEYIYTQNRYALPEEKPKTEAEKYYDFTGGKKKLDDQTFGYSGVSELARDIYKDKSGQEIAQRFDEMNRGKSYKETGGKGAGRRPSILRNQGAENLPYDVNPNYIKNNKSIVDAETYQVYENFINKNPELKDVDSSQWTNKQWQDYRADLASKGKIEDDRYGAANIWSDGEIEKENIWGENVDGFRDNVNTFITEKLIDGEDAPMGSIEETVVKQMNEIFGEYDFEFVEDDGLLGVDGGDAMIVYKLDPITGSRTKFSEEIDLDTISSDAEEATKLKNFLMRHRPKRGNAREEFTKKRFNTKEALDVELRKFNNLTKSFEKTTATVQENKAKLEQNLAILKRMDKNDPNYETLRNQVKEEWDRVDGEMKRWEWLRGEYAAMGSTLDRAAGELYMFENLPTGNFAGATWNHVLKETNAMAIGATGVVLDMYAINAGYSDAQRKKQKYGEGLIINPKDVNQFSQAATGVDKEVDKGVLSTMRDNVVLDALMHSPTKQSYIDKMQEDSILAQGFFGVLGSAPAMALSLINPAIGVAAFTAQSYEHIDRQMSEDPAFDKLSEEEKDKFKYPMMAAIGLLESFGFRNVTSKSPMFKNILSKALGVSSKRTSTKTFNEILRTEINNGIKRYGATAFASALAEAETEAAQELVDQLGQIAFNNANDIEAFQTPETVMEGAKQVGEAALAGAIGGAIVDNVGRVSNIVRKTKVGPGVRLKVEGGVRKAFGVENIAEQKYDFSELTDEQWALFQFSKNNTKAMDLIKERLQVDVLNGKLTAKQAKKDLEIFEQVSQTTNEIPTHLGIGQQKESLGLLLQKKELQEEIENKDPSLSQNIKKQIEAIDTRLKEIGDVDKLAQQKSGDYVVYTPSEGSVYDEKTKTIKGGNNMHVNASTVTREKMIEKINNLKTQEDVVMSGLYVSNDVELADMLNKKIKEINDIDGVSNRFSYQVVEGSGDNMASGMGIPFRRNIKAVENIAKGEAPFGSRYQQFKDTGEVSEETVLYISDKINKEGVESLTEEEQEMASKFMSDTVRFNEEIQTYEPKREGVNVVEKNQRLDSLDTRMNNAELINEKEISEAADELYDDLIELDERTDISQEAKGRIKEKIESEIRKLEGYEFETETKVGTTTKKTTVKGARKVGRKTKNQNIKTTSVPKAEGLKVRFTGKGYKQEGDQGVLRKETRADGKDMYVIEYLSGATTLVNEDMGNPEINYDADGNPESVTLKDKSGNTMVVEDANYALDEAIIKRENEIGAVEEAVLDEVLEEVTQEITTTEEVIKDKTKKDAVQKQSPGEVDATQQTRDASKMETRESTTKSKELTGEKLQDKKDSKSKEQSELDTLFDEVVGEKQTTKPQKKIVTTETVTVNNPTNRPLSRVVKKIIQQAENVAKSLKEIAPDIKIILHATPQEYKASVPGTSAGERGAYDPNTNTIHINLLNAASGTKGNTVNHEAFHALLYNAFGKESLVQAFSKEMLDGLKKASKKGSEMEAKLEEYISQYEDTGQHNEEKLAEIFGDLATNYDTLDVRSKNIFKRLLEKLAALLNLKQYQGDFTKDNAAMVRLMNNLATKVSKGEVITEADLNTKEQEELLEQEEQGESGEVGTIKLKRAKEEVIDAPNPQEDSRSWIRRLVDPLAVKDFNGKNFVTNMYDYTNAGVTDLGNGYKINLLGGRNYVPIIMDKLNKKLGDVSNLAAFNTKSQAEGFIRNAIEGKANLFAPHSGTLDGSWQFQQHIFEELVNLVLDENILSNKELINAFNQGLVRTPKALESELKKYKKNLKSFNNKGYYLNKDKQRVEESPVKPTKIIEPLRKFIRKYNEEQSKEGSNLPKLKNTKNLNDFLNNPKELVKLLNIENNLSPDLRKRLNQKIAANKKFQKAIGIKNLGQFHQRIMDPLNKGVVGGEIMTFVQFDPTTFEVAKTNPNDVDHHPSFGWVVKAKIEKIYQPNKFYKSYDLTETYTKYNTNETKVSRKTDKGFVASNVTSSAGSLPKVAEIKRQLAPNGQPSNLNPEQYKLVRTPAFKKWFGNWETDPENASKIVDENGEPMVVYHGSAADFDVFDKKKLGSLTNTEIAQAGFFFASNKASADQYAFIGGLQNPYMENKLTESRAFFLNIKNPYKATNEEWNDLLNWASDGSRKYTSPASLRKANKDFKKSLLTDGFDGIDFDNGLEIVAFEPNQAKLADGSNVTFDPEQASIKRQLGDTNKINSFVSKAKSRGYSDSAIKTALESKGVSKSVIERIFKVKKAPSAAKIIGKPKPKKITIQVNTALKEKLRAIARETKNVKRAVDSIRKEIQAEIKQITKGRKASLSPATLKNITSKINNANLFTKEGVLNMDAVMDVMVYVDEQLNKAEKKVRRSALNKRRENALKNINRGKLGIPKVVTRQMERLFAVEASLIPDSVLNEYTNLVSKIGEKKSVLSLDEISSVEKTVDKILEEIEKETSRIPAYAMLIEDNILDTNVKNEDGTLNYKKTVDKLVEQKVISQKQGEEMMKYKKEILPPPAPKTKEEIALKEEEQRIEKEILEEEIKDSEINSEKLTTRDERKLAKTLNNLIKSDGIKELDNLDLKRLQQVIDNINNGWLPHLAQVMVYKINAANKSKVTNKAVKTSKPFSSIVSAKKIRATINKSLSGKTSKRKNNVYQLISTGSLNYIDLVLGNRKGKPIFENIFEGSAKAYSNQETDQALVDKKLDEALNKIMWKYKYNPNSIKKSQTVLMTYLLQREFESNPGRKGEVYSAASYLKDTIEFYKGKSELSDQREAKMLEEVLKKYSNADGEIEAKTIYKSLNRAERNAIKVIDEVNTGLTEKAEYTAGVIQGQIIKPIVNYIHHWTQQSDNPYKEDNKEFNDYIRGTSVSTKAKTIESRETGSRALNFDPFGATKRGARMTLLDYHMTPVIRETNMTLTKMKEDLKGESREVREIFDGVEMAYKQVVEDVVGRGLNNSSVGDEIFTYLAKTGYRSMLAGVPRMGLETSVNLLNAAVINPLGFKKGLKIVTKDLSSVDQATIIRRLNSKQQQRLYGDPLTGRMIEPGLIQSNMGVRNKKVRTEVGNRAKQISIFLSAPRKGLEILADTMISAPDKAVMRPLWYGTLAREFKKLTGKDIDFKKIEQNDEAYMNANKEALQEATKIADRDSFFSGATDNPFMGILKNVKRQDDNLGKKIYKNVDRFMLRFLLVEYENTRLAVDVLLRGGEISRIKAGQLLAATTTRMILYSSFVGVLSNIYADLMREMFGFDIEDEEEEKDIEKQIAQGAVSTVNTLLFGRSYGQVVRGIINNPYVGTEYFNEKYGQSLREGEYDPYKDAIGFSPYTKPTEKEKVQGRDPYQQITKLTGPYSVMAKITGKIIQEWGKEVSEKKKIGEVDLYFTKVDVNPQRVLIGLQALGMLNLMPFFKDVNKAAQKEVYKEYNKIKKGEREERTERTDEREERKEREEREER